VSGETDSEPVVSPPSEEPRLREREQWKHLPAVRRQHLPIAERLRRDPLEGVVDEVVGVDEDAGEQRRESGREAPRARELQPCQAERDAEMD